MSNHPGAASAPERPPATHTRPLGVWLMVLSSLCACTGQLLWKVGAQRGLLWVAVGFVLYGVGALLMLVAYRFGELSTLQPILGLSYVLSLLMGALWLHEHVSVGRVVGVVVVVLGVVLIARRPDEPVAEPVVGHGDEHAVRGHQEGAR